MSAAQNLADQRLGAIEKRGDRMARSMSGSFSGAAGSVKRLALSLAGAFTVREIIGLIDKGKQLDAQLKLATATSGNFAKAQEDVRRISAQTRSELGATASLYGNFQRNAKELGITQDDAARATRTVSETFKISGAGAVEAAQATRQLVQALQSGVLRGDEFNSVMESSPRLTRLLAESLGVPIGALRAMAEAGELTSDKLVRAFTDKKFTEGIDAEFKQLPVTFDQALTQIENAAIVVFGAFDRGGQFSNALINFATDGTRSFADLEKSAESFGRTVSSELAGVIAVASNVISYINRINSALQSVGSDNNLQKILDAANPAGALIRASPAYQDAKNDQSSKLALAKVLAGDPFADFGGKNAFFNPNPIARVSPAAKGGGAKKTGGGNTRKSGVSSAARLAEQGAREASRFDADVLRARIDLATNAKDRADLEQQALEQERAEVIRELAARKLLSDSLLKKVNTLYGEPGKTDAQGNILAEGKPGLLNQRVNRELEQREAQIRNDTLSRAGEVLDAWTELETNTQERNKMEQAALALQQEIQRNLLDQEIATGKVADAELAQGQLVDLQTAARIRLARSQRTPGQKYIDDIRESAGNINDAIEDIQIKGLESLNDGLVEAIMGAKSLGDVFKNVANQIIGDLLRIAVQKAIIGPLADALFGGKSNSSGLGDIAVNLAGKIFGRASGGYVAPGQMYRVNESATPGNVEGFMPSGGGRVIPLGQMNAMRSGAQQGGVATVRLELSGDIDARIQSVSAGVAVEVVRASAPSLIDASARETMARAGRPRL
jgi:tape measure domain-containing protein